MLREAAPPTADPSGAPAASIPIRPSAPATPTGALRLRRDWVEVKA